MFIIDYEDAVHIAGPDGLRHAGTVSGIVAPDSPGSAGLGHSPTALADQAWEQLTLRVDEELGFEAGRLIFVDGSLILVELHRRDSGGGSVAYDLKLERS